MKIVVTSALPYINGVKHLGNLIGSMLPADVCARFERMRGNDVLFVCGTDDHGTPAELAAISENLPPEEYCRKYHAVQQHIYSQFSLSFDFFGRTSSAENFKLTRALFLKLRENNLIEERESLQLYSIDDGRFLPDRYVIGTCPKCAYENAKGDQCDSCGTLLDPTDLIHPRSIISGSSHIELRKSKHLYFNLPLLALEIEKWVNSKSGWPKNVVGIAKKWLNEGLQPRCITRDLKWGIPVPLEGYESKVFYVWFDAPIAYISLCQEWATSVGRPEAWSDYWKDPETKLIQFMAKDNVPFHTVMWPGILIGSRENFILPHMIKGFEWLQFESSKFSTSSKRGIFTDEALRLFPADLWRYYLLKIAPEKQDSDFSWLGFQEAVNKDLADILGNFANRTLVFLNRHFQGIVPPMDGANGEVLNRIKLAVNGMEESLQELKFINSIKHLREFWQFCNQYFESSAPFRMIKTDRDKAGKIMANCIILLRSAAALASPFIPTIAQSIYKNLNLPMDVQSEAWSHIGAWNSMAGLEVHKSPSILVTKIEDQRIQELSNEYSS